VDDLFYKTFCDIGKHACLPWKRSSAGLPIATTATIPRTITAKLLPNKRWFYCQVFVAMRVCLKRLAREAGGLDA